MISNMVMIRQLLVVSGPFMTLVFVLVGGSWSQWVCVGRLARSDFCNGPLTANN
jgi:hypothetical protein